MTLDGPDFTKLLFGGAGPKSGCGKLPIHGRDGRYPTPVHPATIPTPLERPSGLIMAFAILISQKRLKPSTCSAGFGLEGCSEERRLEGSEKGNTPAGLVWRQCAREPGVSPFSFHLTMRMRSMAVALPVVSSA